MVAISTTMVTKENFAIYRSKKCDKMDYVSTRLQYQSLKRTREKSLDLGLWILETRKVDALFIGLRFLERESL